MKVIITGRIVDTQEALQWVLVNKVVSKDKLMEEPTEFATQICENPQGCVRTDKESALRSSTAIPSVKPTSLKLS